VLRKVRGPFTADAKRRAVVFSPAPNDSQYRIDIFADFSSSPSEQFHYLPDKFHLMPEPTTFAYHRSALKASPTRLLNERSFSMMANAFY
jgi:hypothetical protein